jgi:hypothetical protein
MSRETADQPPATAGKVKVIGSRRAQTPAFVLVHLRVNSCRAVQEMADPGKNHHRSRSPRCAAEGAAAGDWTEGCYLHYLAVEV